MNEENQNTSSLPFFWPLLLSSLAFNFFLFFHLYTVTKETLRLRNEQTVLLQQVDTYQKNVVGARNIQAMLQALANDLLEIGTSDSEIRNITEKYQIRRVPASTSPKP